MKTIKIELHQFNQAHCHKEQEPDGHHAVFLDLMALHIPKQASQCSNNRNPTPEMREHKALIEIHGPTEMQRQIHKKLSENTGLHDKIGQMIALLLHPTNSSHGSRSPALHHHHGVLRPRMHSADSNPYSAVPRKYRTNGAYLQC